PRSMLRRSLPPASPTCEKAMGKVRIPYYVVVKGRGYWRPHPRMKVLGFQIVRCGPDGPDAWAIAQSWSEKWQAVRRGDAPPPVDLSKLSRDQAEAAHAIRRDPWGPPSRPTSGRRNGPAARSRPATRYGGRRGIAFARCGATSTRTRSRSPRYRRGGPRSRNGTDSTSPTRRCAHGGRCGRSCSA